MRVIETENYYVFDVNMRYISPNSSRLVEDVINNISTNKDLSLDMQNVENFSNEFMDMLYKVSQRRKITLVNTSSESLVLLYLSGVDKYLNIYQSSLDMESGMNRLINRKFSVV